MKKYFLSFIIINLVTCNLFGQKTNEIIIGKIGYSATNIVFKEAKEPTAQIFGINFKTGKTFTGNGMELGAGKYINNNLFTEFSITTFNGKETKLKVNNNEHYYTLKGYQIPLSINYLLRDSSKKLRINAGVGFQYLNGKLEQFEKKNNTNGQTVNQITNIKVSELQILLRPGIPFRIMKYLFLSFTVKVAISTNGRYLDNPCLSLNYIFKKK